MGRPVYRKMGNENMFLSYINSSRYYESPWTFWGGPYQRPGSYRGNLKLSPNTTCPEDYEVSNGSYNEFILAKLLTLT